MALALRAPRATGRPARRHDLRLLPAALTVWVGGLAGLLLGWWLALVVGGLAVVVAGVLLWPRRMPLLSAAGALLLAGLLVGGPLAVVLLGSAHDPLRAAAEAGGEAVARVELTDRPRPVRTEGYANQRGSGQAVVVGATVQAVQVGRIPLASKGRVLLVAPSARWSELLPGQQVTVSGSLTPARSGELTVAVLQVRGPPSAVSAAPWWQRAAASVRAGLRAACGVLEPEEAGLLPGLVVGDTTGMSRRVEEEFRDAGMSHLTAVSGANAWYTYAMSTVKVGQYGRASHLNEFSVDSQLAENQAWVDRESTWRTAGVWRDDGISASRHGRKPREDWPKVMAAIESREIEILLVWEISRASRDRMVFAALFAACESTGVKIGVQGRLYDLDDPDDAFQLDLMASLAVRESGVTSKRIKRNVRARAGLGRPHGKIPYGYLRVYDEHTKKLIEQIKNPDTAPIVEEIARHLLAGDSSAAIAADLDGRGIPCPAAYRLRRLGKTPPDHFRWDPLEVRRLALDPTNAGRRTHNGVDVGLAVWPAIISEEDHSALTVLLRDPTRRTNGHTDSRPKHLLAGLARCGYVFDDDETCGAPMRRVKNRNTPSYDCSAHHHVSRQQAKSDQLVEDVIVARFERPDAASLFVIDESPQADAEKELRELEDRLEAHTIESAEGRLSAARLAKIEAILQPKIDRLRIEARPVGLPVEVTALLEANSPRRVWDGFDTARKRRVIRAIVTVRILPKEPGMNIKVWRDDLIQFDWR